MGPHRIVECDPHPGQSLQEKAKVEERDAGKDVQGGAHHGKAVHHAQGKCKSVVIVTILVTYTPESLYFVDPLF